MGFYIKKPIAVEVITFDEFVEYGVNNSIHPHWSFEYKGHPVTHENDQHYILVNAQGPIAITPNDVIITGIKGEVYPCPIDVFKESYQRAPGMYLPGNGFKADYNAST